MSEREIRQIKIFSFHTCILSLLDIILWVVSSFYARHRMVYRYNPFTGVTSGNLVFSTRRGACTTNFLMLHSLREVVSLKLLIGAHARSSTRNKQNDSTDRSQIHPKREPLRLTFNSPESPRVFQISTTKPEISTNRRGPKTGNVL